MSLPEDPFDSETPNTEDDGIIYTKVFRDWDVSRPNMSTNAGKNSAMEQGSTIPTAWKPSVSEPVPVVRCTATAKATGKQCGRWSLRGATVCIKHGARLPNVEAHSRAVVEAAQMRILGMADKAVDGLQDLLKEGTPQQIRLNAIKEVLDRSGLKGGPDISVEVTHTVSYKDEIASRLKDIKERKAALEKASSGEEDIEDAEIVDEPEEKE